MLNLTHLSHFEWFITWHCVFCNLAWCINCDNCDKCDNIWLCKCNAILAKYHMRVKPCYKLTTLKSDICTTLLHLLRTAARLDPFQTLWITRKTSS